MPLEIGSHIAHYSVTALIGEGGIRQVYQATDTTLNRQVALKIPVDEALPIAKQSAEALEAAQRIIHRDQRATEGARALTRSPRQPFSTSRTASAV